MNTFFRPSLDIFHLSGYSAIEDITERMLRIVYKDYKSSFAELLSEGKSFTVHLKNVQKLSVEIYKI